jgi:tetratricopeptide (TPR) repeat protein
MTNEEAKELYVRAVAAFDNHAYQEALGLFEELDRERPNSRQVMFHRARCLIALGRIAEVQEDLPRLEGKIEKERMNELREAIEAARAANSAANSAPPTASTDSGGNTYIIESVFAASTNETTVVGHVQSGVFHTGDTVTILPPDGAPLLAPILRIGAAETPLNLVRAGQKTVLLLKVEPHLVVPGTMLTSEGQGEYYAATMVVSTEAKRSSNVPASAETVEAEKLLKQRKYAEACAALEGCLAREPQNRVAHWLLARAYLESSPPLRDQAKALESIRRAYEHGGAEDPAIIDTLAHALAANGEAEQGLRFLERLYGGDLPLEARMALAHRILEYRDQYHLGHVWEFADTYGEVVFEAKTPEEVAKAIRNGALARDAKCRKDRIGEWRELMPALAADHPEIAALLEPVQHGPSRWLILVIVGLVAAIVVLLLLL